MWSALFYSEIGASELGGFLERLVPFAEARKTIHPSSVCKSALTGGDVFGLSTPS